MGEMNAKVNDIKLDGTMALVVLILSICVCPGPSTMVAGFLCGDEDKKRAAIIIGLIQWIFDFVIVGWVWAILSAIKIYKNSK